LNATGARLEGLNRELVRHRADLEERVAERTTALRASQARVIQQEKMAAFGLLAAGIAHEVGNPLAALSSLVQMLQRRGPDPYSGEKLEEARRQIDRIRRTVRELVEFSRPASPARSAVRLADVIEEALGIAKYAHRAQGRQIVTRVEPELPPVHAPRDHLTQVILNLVLNALDATERGGRVEIVAEHDGAGLVLSVEDDGRGVRPEDLPRLFQPYFTTKARGTGLGLFVSREILAELGGTLGHRDRPGGGSVFTIALPLPPGEGRPDAMPAREACA
jgi:signal transduction histidine kinase